MIFIIIFWMVIFVYVCFLAFPHIFYDTIHLKKGLFDVALKMLTSFKILITYNKDYYLLQPLHKH